MNKKPTNNDESSPPGNIASQASAWYSEQFFLRSALQIIFPGYGWIDTIIKGCGDKDQSQHVQHFLSEIDLRLKRIEGRFDLPTIEPSEEWIDFTIQVLDYVRHSRSEEKRRRFANLLTNQIVKQSDWDEAEIACRLVKELTDHHIKMLDIALKAPVCDGVFDGLRIVTFSADQTKLYKNCSKGPTNIKKDFSSLSDMATDMICCNLLSLGLVYDEGMGRHGGPKAHSLLRATDLAQWLMDWISEPMLDNKSC